MEAEKPEIEFRSGNVYRYYNVPPRLCGVQLFVEFEGSAGRSFNEYQESVQFGKVWDANS